MDIIEQARLLGQAIQQDARYIAFDQARRENDADAQLQEDIGAFELTRLSLDNALNAQEREEEKIQALNERLRGQYTKIMSHPGMAAYQKAKQELDAALNDVNTLIALSVRGEDPLTCEIPAGCSGGCDSCGGCR